MRPKMTQAVLRAVTSLVLIVLLSVSASARPSVAVVLGGGAARGYSHIGLLKAFEEEGIPVDILVGTSMGSVVAGLYAAGLSLDQLQWMVEHVELSELFSPIIPPRGGLLDTMQFERFLSTLTGGAFVEELDTPFYSVITNVVTGESVALDRGPLSTAIVASMSIPGMFPPVTIDGAVYVDGGIKEPVPALAARQVGADVVIAVDVRRELEEIDHDAILTNLQLTLYFLLDANTEEQLQYADVVISPDVALSSYMEYTEAAYFVEKGYAAAKKAIPEIKALLMEKDPSITFQPLSPRGSVSDEAFRRRFDEALAAARASHSGPWLQSSSALVIESGLAPRLDFELRARLAGSKAAAIKAEYAHSRRFGGRTAQSLGLGAEAGALSGSLFLRRTLDDVDFHPGIGLRARFGGGTGGRLILSSEWVRRDVTQVDQLFDAVGEWSFPLERRGLWELAMLEPSMFIGLGYQVSSGASPGDETPSQRWRVEAGYDFSARLFGIYPLSARLSLTYRGGDSPWALAIQFGDSRSP